jgi:hypothetical protein
MKVQRLGLKTHECQSLAKLLVKKILIMINIMREEILNSIFEIKNKNDNTIIPIIKKELQFETSIKENIWHVFINDIKLKKTSEYIISYKCLNCNHINSVGTTQILRKIRQNKTGCFNCININNYNYLKSNQLELPVKKISTKLEKISNQEFYKNSIIEFETYPDQYKNSYFLSHLTIEDYNRIKKNIISYCNGKYTDINSYEFWSVYKVNNQMKFSSILYDSKNDIIFKANQPIIKCDNCTKNWRCKSLESFKNDYKLLCQECKLCNRIFKIRPIKNINNSIITYQSKLELKFVNWCNNNNIIVNNGPNIDYIFNNKEKKYRVDFQINNILIEIKDYHIWHNNQVSSGLWDIKMEAVNNFIKNNKLDKYIFMTPHNWNQMIKELLNLLNKI